MHKANEILKLASAIFVQAELECRLKSYGVEPICKVLQIGPSGYWRHETQQRNPQLRSARAKRDDTSVPHIERVWQANPCVYGTDKVLQMNREGIT